MEEAMTALEDTLLTGRYTYRGTYGVASAEKLAMLIAYRAVINGMRRNRRYVEVEDLDTAVSAMTPVFNDSRMRVIRESVNAYFAVLGEQKNSKKLICRFEDLVRSKIAGWSTKEALVENGVFNSVDEISVGAQNAADQRRSRDRKLFIESIKKSRCKQTLKPRDAELLLGLLK